MKPRVCWTDEKIRALAPEVKTRTGLSKTHGGAYRYAQGVPGLLDALFGNQKFVWTEKTLREEASKYKTKSEFHKGSGGAYFACLSRFPGLVDDLFGNLIRFWKDEGSVRLEAAKYGSRSDFRYGSPGASKAAVSKFPHILDELFGDKLVTVWSLEKLKLEATKFSSRVEFKGGAGGAYNALLRFHGELDKIFPLKYRYWSNEADIRAEASKYRTKSEFVYGCVSAYGAALDLGIIDDLGFEPGESGFDTQAPTYLYLTSLALTDGGAGVLFGITNRTPKVRYTLLERAFMGEGSAYLFQKGADALRIETSLRREFLEFAAIRGQSPLRDKLGTAGEILSGVPLEFVMEALSTYCTELPPREPW